MAREHLLCSALVLKDRRTRVFSVWKTREPGFFIREDNGDWEPGAAEVTEAKIIQELYWRYKADDVQLQGSLREGLNASTWPHTAKSCSNCGCKPTRWRHERRGCCRRCYYFACRLEAAKELTFGKPTSWKRFMHPLFANDLSPDRLSPEEFATYKEAYIEYMQERLEALRATNICSEGKLSAIDLARKFDEVFVRLTKKSIPFTNVSQIENSLNGQQMSLVFSLLDDIIGAASRNSDGAAHSAGSSAVAKFRRAKQAGRFQFDGNE